MQSFQSRVIHVEFQFIVYLFVWFVGGGVSGKENWMLENDDENDSEEESGSGIGNVRMTKTMAVSGIGDGYGYEDVIEILM